MEINKIQFCPICAGELHKPKELAEGVKECRVCKSRFFILITTRPQKKVVVRWKGKENEKNGN